MFQSTLLYPAGFYSVGYKGDVGKGIEYLYLLFYSGCRYTFVFEHLDSLPGKFWYCDIWIMFTWTSSLCSILFILNMTFERFYSIIKPHKAASFNTVKRAKITILCYVCISVLFNIPHLFVTLKIGESCIPFGKAVNVFVEVYYWFSLIVNFFLPFVLLLIMNSVIIRTLQQRSGIPKIQGQGRKKGQTSKMKNTDKQIFITLLLVTFGFLVLNAPAYSFFVYGIWYDFYQSPKAYAAYFLFGEFSAKAYYTNYGINFFFYVMSGQKFRADLVRLVTCCAKKQSTDPSEMNTVSSCM